MGSSPSTPARLETLITMQNPLNFLRSVKQEIFKITWPTSKEALMGTVMVIAMAVVASLFFLLLDQFFKVGLNYLIGA